jgi:hypothetical protein
MTNNLLTLWCLIEGDSTTFSIKDFPLSNTVDDLKEAINNRLKFGTSSTDLTLWRVSIPFPSHAEDQIPIVLDRIIDKTRLRSDQDISEVFEATPLKKTIHIVIQPPLRGNVVFLLCTQSRLTP